MGLYTSEEIIMNTAGKRWTVGPGKFQRSSRKTVTVHLMKFITYGVDHKINHFACERDFS